MNKDEDVNEDKHWATTGNEDTVMKITTYEVEAKQIVYCDKTGSPR